MFTDPRGHLDLGPSPGLQQALHHPLVAEVGRPVQGGRPAPVLAFTLAPCFNKS